MGSIRVLDPEVAAQIAAGEVIERPASVVKELIDNALDAGAHRVRVELEEGGLRAITVVDDGCGMDRSDAARCFLRHATSKISALADLQALRTLGFRGEALPSIAAVCRVELVTRPATAESAAVVRLSGGGPPEVTVGAGPPGTRVVARDIFFNTPARRAMLRTPAQERALAAEVVAAAALARPDVAFSLWHDGKEVLSTPGDGQLLSAVVALWGAEEARSLLPVAAASGGWEVRGLCAPPDRARGHRGHQYLAVDGRPVRCEGIRGAVEAAYRNLLMTRRFPAFVLQLRARAPGLYDPNVHPSKREVRIAQEGDVRELCRQAVRAALARAELIPGPPAGAAAAREPGPPGRPTPLPGAVPWPQRVAFAVAAQAESPQPAAAPEGGAAIPLPAGGRLPALRVLGQVASSYVAAEGPDGLYLVDQHAAHERIFFERLGAERPPVRALVLPMPISLTAEQYACWEAAAEALAATGFTVEPFGAGTVLLRAVPGGLPGDPVDLFVATLSHVAGEGHDPLAVRRAVAACRAAVKAGEPLSPEDLAHLLRELDGCAEPFTCPHGRPTLVRLTLAELERMFRRR